MKFIWKISIFINFLMRSKCRKSKNTKYKRQKSKSGYQKHQCPSCEKFFVKLKRHFNSCIPKKTEENLSEKYYLIDQPRDHEEKCGFCCDILPKHNFKRHLFKTCKSIPLRNKFENDEISYAYMWEQLLPIREKNSFKGMCNFCLRRFKNGNMNKHFKKCKNRKDYIKFRNFYDKKIITRETLRFNELQKDKYKMRQELEKRKQLFQDKNALEFERRLREERENFAIQNTILFNCSKNLPTARKLRTTSLNEYIPIELEQFKMDYRKCLRDYDLKKLNPIKYKKRNPAYIDDCEELSQIKEFSVVYTSDYDGSIQGVKHFKCHYFMMLDN